MKRLMLVIGMTVVLFGCATTKVERVDIDKKVDLSGRWNDHDAYLASKELIKDCLERSWVEKFSSFRKREPSVIVGNIVNRTDEHIDPAVIVKDMETELMNSGRVSFVASSYERLQIRTEREDQQKGYTDPARAAQLGKELGADFILIGSINSIKDEIQGKYVILYQINAELIDVSTNEKVWLGQKEIKKIVKKSKYSL
ncbi:MAG: penicillin-binding protein activator LpoB [Candidatus Omnitrophica bacterium]|nr:penicillin-binding protein activator LpoB [Candidatus Omnitrophota bacterium]